MRSHDIIRVVDLFAGPGGLGEGFSAFRASDRSHPFRIALSIENDPAAHRTLTLRAFFRQFRHRGLGAPAAYYEHLRGRLEWDELRRRHPAEWSEASSEALFATLGGPGDRSRIDDELGRVLSGVGEARTVVIGGPPCQAYSLIGRARNRGVRGYRPERDGRHFLYEEYLAIIARVWPAVFVLENVKGMLSSEIRGRSMFERILGDLADPSGALGSRRRGVVVRPVHRYRVVPLFPSALPAPGRRDAPPPERFVVRCEDHGIPQRRHRVILVGIRDDLDGGAPSLLSNDCEGVAAPSVRDMIGMLPAVRSRLSSEDSIAGWRAAVGRAGGTARGSGAEMSAAMAEVRRVLKRRLRAPSSPGAEWVRTDREFPPVHRDRTWFLDRRIGGVCNHAARSHMEADLHRYLYAACFARVHRVSPKLWQFPWSLLPDHMNVREAMEGRNLFSDRFRVQCADAPATTVTAHMGKDGHYYIHPDPVQCRSLTVREAARLQTFPDNYYFEGPRSAQYRQVGNAVPPLLALRIADGVHSLLGGRTAGE